MRGIRIKLSVFEFDVLKQVIKDEMARDKRTMVNVALGNILGQFERKSIRAEQNERVKNDTRHK